MPSIYQIKPAFQNALRPLCGSLVGAGVTANAVTVAAMILSLGVGAAIASFPAARWPLLLLPAALFVRMALNAIDGMIAREHQMQTRMGAILNEVGDVLSDTVLYLPLALVPGMDAQAIVAIVILAIVSEFVGVLGPTVAASRRYDGPMGKSDRAFALGALSLALGLGAPTGTWVFVILVVLCILLVVTIVNRARGALAEGGQA